MEFKFTKYVIGVCERRIGYEEFCKVFDLEVGEVIVCENYHYEVVCLKHEDDYCFVGLHYGDPMPHPEEVWDAEDGVKKENPRKESQIEMRNQLFIYFDGEDKLLYFSDRRKTKLIRHLVSEKMKCSESDVLVNFIEDEEAFIKSAKSIKSITFIDERNMFTRKYFDLLDNLPNIEKTRFAGYPVECKVTVNFKGGIGRLVEKAIAKFIDFAKDQHQNCGTRIVMTSEGQDGFLRIFNPSTMLQNVSIKVKADKNKMCDPHDVLFQIRKIME